MSDNFKVRRFSYEPRAGRGIYENMTIDVVPTFVERIVPPAGDEYAFDIQHHRRRVDICVSPSGRSVRIFVDGNEVKP